MNHNGGRRRSAQGKGREEEGSQRNESRIFLPWMVTWNLGDAPSWVFPALALSEGGNCTGTEREGSGASVLIQPPYRFKEEGGNRTPGKKINIDTRENSAEEGPSGGSSKGLRGCLRDTKKSVHTFLLSSGKEAGERGQKVYHRTSFIFDSVFVRCINAPCTKSFVLPWEQKFENTNQGMT